MDVAGLGAHAPGEGDGGGGGRRRVLRWRKGGQEIKGRRDLGEKSSWDNGEGKKRG